MGITESSIESSVLSILIATISAIKTDTIKSITPSSPTYLLPIIRYTKTTKK